ncbi:hypothetical protein T440DRAFT_80218 [Plenodomus tracheiphilus IPT5]|uniref:Uncharacterized protein n=1 Tax=Plenodomus tracheiphilus IPT5 TaxID=1408161 RepID=A0A6A7B8C7_9PLEO|nr:hypothetical protein T440DRAFT_80218 [Plenodomus tracheiphilus IPT5]
MTILQRLYLYLCVCSLILAVCNHLSPLTNVLYCPVPSRPVSSRLVSSRPVPSRPVPSCLVSSCPVLPYNLFKSVLMFGSPLRHPMR